MNKIFLIIQREFLTRVRKKTFIISTILFPLLYLALIFGSGYLAEAGMKKMNIALVDHSGLFDKGAVERQNLQDSSSLLTLVTENNNVQKSDFEKKGYDGFIVIPSDIDWEKGIRDLPVYTSKTLGSDAIRPVQTKITNIWNEIKQSKLGLDAGKLAVLTGSNIVLKTQNANDARADASVSSILGFVSGFLIYFILILYGSQVMMGVMEEKTNRVAEVLVSSVKPFQLMVGKIVGIGLVALTQFILWVVFIYVIYSFSGIGKGGEQVGAILGAVQHAFTSVNVPLILGCFAFYLLGGFFFYASLYAAIGSAVNEDMREAQSLSFPITMLVIIAIVMMTAAMRDPTGPIAVWGSLIPFTSPIIMMARIPFGVPETVPYWQLGLSMLLLVLGFLGTTWFAGKIYRTGILMYGKKPTWGEMLKWAFKS